MLGSYLKQDIQKNSDSTLAILSFGVYVVYESLLMTQETSDRLLSLLYGWVNSVQWLYMGWRTRFRCWGDNSVQTHSWPTKPPSLIFLPKEIKRLLHVSIRLQVTRKTSLCYCKFLRFTDTLSLTYVYIPELTHLLAVLKLLWSYRGVGCWERGDSQAACSLG